MDPRRVANGDVAVAVCVADFLTTIGAVAEEESVSSPLCSTTAEVEAVSTDAAIAGIVRVNAGMSASRMDKSFRVIMDLLSIRRYVFRLRFHLHHTKNIKCFQ